MKIVQTQRRASAFSKTAEKIMDLMMDGLTASEIAETLGVDVRIVCYERHQLFKTLGIKNELQFLARSLYFAMEEIADLIAENEFLKGQLAA